MSITLDCSKLPYEHMCVDIVDRVISQINAYMRSDILNYYQTKHNPPFITVQNYILAPLTSNIYLNSYGQLMTVVRGIPGLIDYKTAFVNKIYLPWVNDQPIANVYTNCFIRLNAILQVFYGMKTELDHYSKMIVEDILTYANTSTDYWSIVNHTCTDIGAEVTQDITVDLLDKDYYYGEYIKLSHQSH